MIFDNPLSSILKNLERQNECLAKARNFYLQKEAERKHFEAVLISKAPGKSQAERVTWAHAQAEFLEFHRALARLEAVFRYQEFKYEILEKEWQSSYLETKLNDGLIKKQRD